MTSAERHSEPGYDPTPVTAVAARAEQPEALPGTVIGRWVHTLTIADGLMALVVGLGAILRFSNLGLVPLSPAEAENGLASWQFWHNVPVSANIGSPAYFTLTNALLPFLGDSDTIMRLVPALFGLGVVALPWLLRRQWPAAAMLVAGLFLAVSPLNIFASRQVGGQSIAIFALLLLVVAMWRLRPSASVAWSAATGVSLALGLTSDPLFYSGFVTLVVAWLFTGGIRGEGPEDGTTARHLSWRTAVIAAGVSLLVLSTSFLLHTQAIGSSLQVGTSWLGQFGWPAPSGESLLRSIATPFAAVARYEPALLLLGLPALAWAFINRGPGRRWLALWAVGLVVLSVIQIGTRENALALTLPGYLLIGLLAGYLATSREPDADPRITWLVAGGLTLLGGVLLVSVARFTRLGLWSSDQAALLGLATVSLLAAGAVIVLALSYDRSSARLGAFIGVGIWLIYAQWGLAYQLSHPGANDSRELWIEAATDQDIRTMMGLVGDVSRQVTNSATGLQVTSLVESPVLAWYLRDFERAQFAEAVPLLDAPEALITGIESEARLSADYMGADFGLAITPLPGPLAQSAPDLLRWWLFRESDQPVQSAPVIFWLRSDLVGP